MTILQAHKAIDDDVGDDLLRLVFIVCHPVLSTEARAALTLRLLGGLTTEEIARAFLVPEPTVAQRIASSRSWSSRPRARRRAPARTVTRSCSSSRIARRLETEPALRGYHLLPTVRADFLAKLGRNDEARVELLHAASLARNGREKELLLQRAHILRSTRASDPGT